MNIADYTNTTSSILQALLADIDLSSFDETTKATIIKSLLETSVLSCNNYYNLSMTNENMQKDIELKQKQIDNIDSELEAKLANMSAQTASINKDIELKQKQIDNIDSELEAKLANIISETALKSSQKQLIDRQKTALDDAVKRDVAKIVCEALAIIKSSGNSAGSWWDTASKSINNLAGTTLSTKSSD